MGSSDGAGDRREPSPGDGGLRRHGRRAARGISRSIRAAIAVRNRVNRIRKSRRADRHHHYSRRQRAGFRQRSAQASMARWVCRYFRMPPATCTLNGHVQQSGIRRVSSANGPSPDSTPPMISAVRDGQAEVDIWFPTSSSAHLDRLRPRVGGDQLEPVARCRMSMATPRVRTFHVHGNLRRWHHGVHHHQRIDAGCLHGFSSASLRPMPARSGFAHR